MIIEQPKGDSNSYWCRSLRCRNLRMCRSSASFMRIHQVSSSPAQLPECQQGNDSADLPHLPNIMILSSHQTFNLSVKPKQGKLKSNFMINMHTASYSSTIGCECTQMITTRFPNDILRAATIENCKDHIQSKKSLRWNCFLVNYVFCNYFEMNFEKCPQSLKILKGP